MQDPYATRTGVKPPQSAKDVKRAGSIFLFSVAASVCLVAAALAANAQKPHPHQGVLKPYTQLRQPQLSANDLQALGAGLAVRRQTEGDGGGRGLAIFRVNATPEMTWSVIADFPSYPTWIEDVSRAEVYPCDGENNICVAFKLSRLVFSLDYYIRHVFHDAEQWGTWTLDYSRESDIDDSVGFWRVTPVAEKPGTSQVEYSVDLQLRHWIPGIVRSLIVDKGLKQATEWVRVQSEARMKARR